MMQKSNILLIFIFIFILSCSKKEEQISVLKEKNLENQMVEVYAEAMKEFEKSSKLKNSYSEYFIGYMYENALGVRKNIKKAIEYYKSSAEKKNFNSTVQLGVLYNEGKEVEKDIDKATEWFVKAADCGLF